MRTAALLCLLATAVHAESTTAPAHYRVVPVEAAQQAGGAELGSGCWMPTVDCIRMARERQEARQALEEAKKRDGGGIHVGTAFVLILAAGAAGYALAVVTR